MDVSALRKQIKMTTKSPHTTLSTKATKISEEDTTCTTNHKLLKVVKIQKQMQKEMYKQMQKQDQNLGKSFSKLPSTEMN